MDVFVLFLLIKVKYVLKQIVENITENNDNHPQTEEITGLKL